MRTRCLAGPARSWFIGAERSGRPGRAVANTTTRNVMRPERGRLAATKADRPFGCDWCDGCQAPRPRSGQRLALVGCAPHDGRWAVSRRRLQRPRPDGIEPRRRG